MTITQSKALAWSKLDTLPIVYQNNGFNLVAWNGILMTMEHGLMVASALRLEIFPTPEMSRIATKQWAKLCHAGAFGHQDVDARLVIWDVASFSSVPGRLHRYYMSRMSKDADKIKAIDPITIVSLF